ncbi:MAG: hypothetical protein NZ908_00455 [Candidatus Micrarchaeota archaeon]|nr:hypothetical protein [Candidatus Micrarchaeota archaeon]MCX8154562.1 hypothetical protein [Candidatus Micrarchaeota archaeon]
MAELQIENRTNYELSTKKINVDNISKMISTVESRIKDDETYAREESSKIIAEIFDFRSVVTSDLNRTLDRIGRSDIIEMFQRMTVTAEQYVAEELNERLNDMLRLATKLTEIAAIGAIAAYLELKSRQEEIEISTVSEHKNNRKDSKERVGLEINRRERDILKKYIWFLRKRWDRFKDEYGVDDPKIIRNILEKQGIIDEGERLFLEIRIAKTLDRDEDRTLSYLKRYAEITNLKIITVMLSRGMSAREVIRMFGGVFRILRLK